ncbi:hypothetical protein TNCV_4886631 [Trichonephila clavipes]|uniref:Uncharacterized protein n=1 Tax=Trichonephila clavipes TaxID=2585209 RepID=A0A8X6RN19_TRICX|nr:hypothetical protein TNCV_4886631 [Trichonephila clavipes]
MTPDDDVGDGERVVLLPEIIGEKHFLESLPLRSQIDSSRKGHARGPFEGTGWKQRAKTCSVCARNYDHKSSGRPDSCTA